MGEREKPRKEAKFKITFLILWFVISYGENEQVIGNNKSETSRQEKKQENKQKYWCSQQQ